MAESTIASTTLPWLRCEMERDTVHFASLNCALCKKYEGHLQSLKNFNAAWIIESTNHKVSNILDNDGSGMHKAMLARKRAEDIRLVLYDGEGKCRFCEISVPA